MREAAATSGDVMDTDRLINTYTLSLKARGLTASHRENVRNGLNSFAQFIGNRPIENIGAADLERWMESLDNVAVSTRVQRLSTVRCFLRWCERRKHVRRNVANDIRGPKLPRRLPRALVTGAPAKLLASLPDTRAVFIVTAMLQQGLRAIELSRLEVSDVDRYHGTMRIVGKGGHERVLPLLPETLFALDDYIGEHPVSSGALVRSYMRPRCALHPSTISHLVSLWMREAGVKSAPRDGVSGHCCRHTCLSDMLLSGAHLRDVQAAAGHAHLATTEIYLPTLVDGLAVAMGGRSYGSAKRHP